MKLRYIANVRLPTEKAHGIQIMSMCAAFADSGAEVELVVPTRTSDITADPFEYYGVKRNFTIRTVPTPQPHDLPLTLLTRLSYLRARFAFARRVLKDARARPADVYYHRDELSFRAFGKAGLPGIWEIHDMPRHMMLYRQALARAPFVVAITNGLKQALEAAGVPAGKILIEPDGADTERFANAAAGDVREKLGLGGSDVLVTYTGSLLPWKGVSALAMAAEKLPQNAYLLIVGGDGAALEELRAGMVLRGVRGSAIGRVAPSDVGAYVTASDIIVIPNSGKTQISREYTSPLKLFEALAAGKAIVASDLPSLREILDGDTAILVPPDDPQALAAALSSLSADPARRAALGKAAAQKAAHYDWRARAARILARLA